MDTQDLMLHLSDTTHEGRRFHVMPIEGKEAVLQVTVSGAEEVPVYLTFDETQILCFTYLFDESEVTPQRLPELLDSMLRLSVPLPLSALGKIDQPLWSCMAHLRLPPLTGKSLRSLPPLPTIPSIYLNYLKNS